MLSYWRLRQSIFEAAGRAVPQQPLQELVVPNLRRLQYPIEHIGTECKICLVFRNVNNEAQFPRFILKSVISFEIYASIYLMCCRTLTARWLDGAEDEL